jgi:NADPH:quinone reductase-like Zn-dependent oxidoreductase
LSSSSSVLALSNEGWLRESATISTTCSITCASSLFVRQQERTFVSTPNQDHLITLKEFIKAGRVTSLIDRTYPLRETTEAFRYLARGNAPGKVVIVVENGE